MDKDLEEFYLPIKSTLGKIIEEYDKAKVNVPKWCINGTEGTRSGWLGHHGLSIASYNALKIFYKSDNDIEGCPLSLKKINTVLTKLGYEVKAVVFVFEK